VNRRLTPHALRFVDAIPQAPAAGGFHWIFIARDALDQHWPALQAAAQLHGGSHLLDLHCQDLANEAHPSNYDYTSVYDLIIFRRLASAAETEVEVRSESMPQARSGPERRARPRGMGFRHIHTRAVGFVLFDRLLISVHPPGCLVARTFVERYLADALHSEAVSVNVRSRLPGNPADLMLRMVNLMVDSYLDLRRQLTTQLEQWQSALLNPRSRFSDWTDLMAARSGLFMLEDLCEEQHDAMQEWLETLQEQPLHPNGQAERDGLVARSRDLIEHIERVVHHVRRLEQSAETAVQIHFSALSHRTNDTMRTLTAITAIFLPLNLVTGFFGMNFEFLPLIHQEKGLWWAISAMSLLALLMAGLFWRKRYLANSGR
jgi:magnesium transporter